MAILDEKITARLLDQIEGNSLQEKWNNCRNEYPWYPLPWLMMARSDSDKQKAALWFRNEHRIHWLLSKDGYVTENGLVDNDIANQLEEETKILARDIVSDDVENISALTKSPDQDADNQLISNDISGMPVTDAVDNAHEPAAQMTDIDSDKGTKENDIDFDEGFPAKTSEEPALKVEDINSEPVSKEEREEPGAVVLTAEEVALKLDTEAVNDMVAGDEFFPSFEEQVEKTEDPAIAKSEAEVAIKSNSAEPSTDDIPLKFELTVEKINVPSNQKSKEEELVFEPLYTTDYFASQGIRVDPKAVPESKFDRQVKSFTQWLKTMKRIAPEVPVAADPLVDAQANESVMEKEVITEAMAEVLEKQGKYQKAIEILGKLILLHPEKSTFFAAQIENLKAKQ